MAELIPGQGKKDITALLASVRPRDIAGKTCRRIAAEELAELVAVDAKIKKSTAELKAMVLARGSHLMDRSGWTSTGGPTTGASAPRQEALRGDQVSEAQDLRRQLSTTPHRRCGRRLRGRERGPGRALRGVSCIQRGRLNPAHRHFGSATPGTRTNDATPACPHEGRPTPKSTSSPRVDNRRGAVERTLGRHGTGPTREPAPGSVPGQLVIHVVGETTSKVTVRPPRTPRCRRRSGRRPAGTCAAGSPTPSRAGP